MSIVLDGSTGITTPAVDTQGNLAYTGTLTGGTGVINIGSGQLVKDAAGNLGLGVTPSAWNSDYKAIDVSTYLTLYGRVATPTSGFSSNSFRNEGGSWIYKTTSGASRYEQDSGFHFWFNAPSGTAGNAISFTQAMTLDSSGNLLVGTTSTSYASGFSLNASNTFGLFVTNSASSAPRSYFSNFTGGGNDTSSYHFIGNTSSVDRVVIYGNGNIQNANNSYGSLSDIKIKENIIDATPKLAKLMQVRVVNYNLKTDPNHKQIGVIAQELEQIFPGMVEETLDRRDKNGADATTTKSVKYSVFVPMLIKAIQEQQAIIEQLKADVAALKGAQA